MAPNCISVNKSSPVLREPLQGRDTFAFRFRAFQDVRRIGGFKKTLGSRETSLSNAATSVHLVVRPVGDKGSQRQQTVCERLGELWPPGTAQQGELCWVLG